MLTPHHRQARAVAEAYFGGIKAVIVAVAGG
jgi:hypothetical protein